MSGYVVLAAGASSGFDESAAKAVSEAGHSVYASTRDITGKNAATVERYAAWARKKGVDLRTVELEVQSDTSVEQAVAEVRAEAGEIDVLLHNAGHMVYGPAEAFQTPIYLMLSAQSSASSTPPSANDHSAST